MKYYAMYMFEKSPACDTAYLLVDHKGNADNVKFTKYTNTDENVNKGIADREYIRFCVPRNESIKKYFAHTFEFGPGSVLTSTEALDEKNRTFGDSKKIGTNDLIIIQFSRDMGRLVMWFVKNKGFSKVMKQESFANWINGDTLIYEKVN